MVNFKYNELISNAILSNRDRAALTDYPGDSLTYSDVAYRIYAIHELFRNEGITVGDRVSICGKNSSNWAVAFLATTTFGTVAVPLLHEFTPTNILNAVNHSGSKVLFVTDEIFRKLSKDQLSSDLICVSLNDLTIIKGNEKIDITIPDDICINEICSVFHEYGHEDMLVLNYTSGTTSSPKGVMIPERAIVSNIQFGYEVMPVLKACDTVVSILPLAHTYSMSFEFLTEFTLGMNIHFLTSRLSNSYLLKAFGDIRPKVIIMVPLILEKIVRKGVLPQINKPIIKQLRKTPIIRKIVNKKINTTLCNKLGGNFYQVIVGGAGLNSEIESVLKSLRFPFTVGFGMTECAPIICYSDWKKFVPGSCGKAAPRMKVKLSTTADGGESEIHVKGDNVMLGYYQNNNDTEAVLDSDGWLHTGDIGKLDKYGNLYIMGRCKTMILGPSGQNIYPEEIEGLLNGMPYISESLVISENGKLVALVYPDFDETRKSDMSEEDLAVALNKNKNEVNKLLPPYEQICNVKIQMTEFEKTPKKSIKRYLYG